MKRQERGWLHIAFYQVLGTICLYSAVKEIEWSAQIESQIGRSKEGFQNQDDLQPGFSHVSLVVYCRPGEWILATLVKRTD